MKIALAAEMKQIENIAINKIGISSIVLMENAANRITDICYDLIKDINSPNIVIFVGKGNNGGDGLAVARLLYQKFCFNKNDISINVVFIGDKENATEECRIQLEILEQYNNNGVFIPINYFSPEDGNYIIEMVKKSDIIIDAIIGTGLKSNIKTEISGIINIINSYSSGIIVSIDISTGLNSDTGVVMGNAINADITIALHVPKAGCMISDGLLYSGKIIVSDISIPHVLDCNLNINYLTKKGASFFIPKRKKIANKGDFGKVYLFAGSDSMPGACIICAKAAYKAGAGIVVACSTEKVVSAITTVIPEAVTKTLKSDDGKISSESIVDAEFFKDASVIAVGPGIGKGTQIFEFVKNIISLSNVPIIIDADGLNAISKNLDILKLIKKSAVITPHLGEMSRLTNIPVSDIRKDLINIAVNFANKNNVVTVLKDAGTVIASPDGRVYINNTGCSAMSKGGFGDCLTGVIAAFISQKMNSFDAAVLACYVCGKAGEKLALENGDFGALATESASYVSNVILDISKNF